MNNISSRETFTTNDYGQAIYRRPQYASFKMAYQNELIAKTAPVSMKLDEDMTKYFESLRYKTLTTSPIRQAYMEFMTAQLPTAMLTVTFTEPLIDRDAINSLWFLCKKVNIGKWHRRWTKHKHNGLKGIIVAEPHELHRTMRNFLHFHVLLSDYPKRAEIDEFREYVSKEAIHVNTKKGGPSILAGASSIDVREVTDIKLLTIYLTKALERPSWNSGDNIMILGPNGIDANLQRDRSTILSCKYV